jgi:hypothetical protein
MADSRSAYRRHGLRQRKRRNRGWIVSVRPRPDAAISPETLGQWHIEIRIGSPWAVRCSCPQLQAASRVVIA